VLTKDLETNTITVTTNPAQLQRNHYNVGDVTWWQQPKVDSIYQVRIRHLGELLECKLEPQADGIWCIQLLHGAHRGVAAGQHAVIYDGKAGLGGGVIQ